MSICAHVDEGGARLPDGRRLCGLAAVVSAEADQAMIAEQLGGLLLPKRPYLHHYDETVERRVKIANVIAALPIHGAIVLTTAAAHTAQERARARLLCRLLPRLQHVEHVERVVFESRSGGDRHDRRTIERLRRSRRITARLRFDHRGKLDDPVTWIADFVMGAYVSSRHHDEPEPWAVIDAAHALDVVKIEPG